MRILLAGIILSAVALIGCEDAPQASPVPTALPGPVPVCAYGGQIVGTTIVCNARFELVPSKSVWSDGKIMFDHKTAQDCWAGSAYGERGLDALYMPTCNSL